MSEHTYISLMDAIGNLNLALLRHDTVKRSMARMNDEG